MFPNDRIEKYYRQCEEIMNFSGLSWWIIDLEQNPDIFYCNNTMCQTFNLDPMILQHSVSKTCPIAGDYNKHIAIKNTQKAQKVFNDYKELKLNKLEEYRNYFPYFDERNDKVLYYSSRAKALLRNDNGEAQLLFGIIEPETTSEKLYKQACTDSLTGLRNRRKFDSHLNLMLNVARREQHSISLILCDIDAFKNYNDQLGHYAGDQCLIQVANSINNTCHRTTDVTCRYGGEEFAIIIYGENKNIPLLSEKISHDLAQLQLPHPDKQRGIVTISTGYASFIPNKHTTSQKIIEKADCGLYLAKSLGGNQSATCTCNDEQDRLSSSN